MPERTRLVDLVTARLEAFIDERAGQLEAVAPDLEVFTDAGIGTQVVRHTEGSGK